MAQVLTVNNNDPATYRLIELLTGEVLALDGTKKTVPKLGNLYVYAAGPQLCTASPNDHAPSNTNYFVGAASYLGNGVVAGSVIVDKDTAITEAGLLLTGPGIAVLLSKTCLTTAVNISAGSEIKVEVRFVL